MTLLLGCIADDFTGATDLANNLVRAGLRVVQAIGVPDAATADLPANPARDADAIVIALKSRTIPAAEAVTQSLAAARFLRARGARQLYFKVCSTFDSTPAGNIGPVLDALMTETGARFAIATPAFPDAGRTVFKGHLFVGDVLLSESGMREHPLTPMTDANLVRVLQAQLPAARRVGLADHRVTGRSGAAVAERCAALQREGVAVAIVDATDNADLFRIAEACRDLPVVCAGSGLAIGLPAAHGLAPRDSAAALPAARGRRAVVAGSCSQATRAQVARAIERGVAAWRLDAARVARADAAGESAMVDDAIAFAERAWSMDDDARVLVYSTAAPDEVAAAQQADSGRDLGERIESLLARIAVALVERGVGRLVVAGGETSGACVQALGIQAMRIGAQIDPGVPWCHAASPHATGGALHIALKSGNFGSVDFFTQAFEALRAFDAHGRDDAATPPSTPGAVDDDEHHLRAELCRAGRTLHARGYVHGTTGNLSARLADGSLLITATDACLGTLTPAALVKVRADGTPADPAQRPSKTLALHGRIYASDPEARVVVHTHSRHLVQVSLAAADGAALDDLLPPITPYFVMKVGHVPLVPYHRPGDPAVADHVATLIGAARERGAPIRLVMLSRLGPNCWHATVDGALAVLEEAEETARLWLASQRSGHPARPLTPEALDDLRHHAGARW